MSKKLINQVDKWVDLNGLPIRESENIDWENSVGYVCDFKYGNIEGEIEIVKYDKKRRILTITHQYEDYYISTSNFQKCGLGKMLKIMTLDFKIEIGTTYKDNKRDLTIIDRYYKEDKNGRKYKFYKYHCNKCGYKHEIVESGLVRGTGCPVCGVNPKIVVPEINSIYTTDPWMIDLGVSEEDAKTHTSQSSKKVMVKCPHCGEERLVAISHIHNNKTIFCKCGDGKSYNEKFIYSLLKQLNLNIIIELSSSTFKWCDKYKYDFYFAHNNEEYIIEAHGLQHYKEGFSRSIKNARTLQQEQENDKIKKELAIVNGIKKDNYIIIDCRYSDLEWIMNSILNSDINKIFDLSNIDWLECEKYSLKNIVKEVCDYWNNKEDWETAKDLANVFNINRATIIRYLKRGEAINWCNYNGEKEMLKNLSNIKKLNGKPVEIFKDNISLGTFESASELERQSEELFGVRLINNLISSSCRGKYKCYKGFTFKYI